jgi:hypothetical protein
MNEHSIYLRTWYYILSLAEFNYHEGLEDTGFGCKRGEIMRAPPKTMDLEKFLFWDRCKRKFSNLY